MLETIALVVCLSSLLGIGIIVLEKIPILTKLSPQTIKERGAFQKLKNKVGNNGVLRSFSSELLLQKILSEIRILTLKMENKTGAWLRKLRRRSLKKKKNFSDDYWEKLKK